MENVITLKVEFVIALKTTHKSKMSSLQCQRSLKTYVRLYIEFKRYLWNLLIFLNNSCTLAKHAEVISYIHTFFIYIYFPALMWHANVGLLFANSCFLAQMSTFLYRIKV